jgi:L-threonylcarbamoyladenylate synthase
MGGAGGVGNSDAASRDMDRETTQRLTPDAAGIARAAAILRAGGLVAFPTETVYGLGGDARSDMAVARIFAAKGRPRFNPLIVHLASVEAARAVARFSAQAERLAAAFWPGPLTLVLPLRTEAGIAPLATAGLATVAVRVPAHPVAQALLAAFGGPVAAPSANPSGRLSPTRAEDVIEGLDGRIAAVVDGGACPVGLESTILGLDGPPVLLRPGGLPAEAVEVCLGLPLGSAAPGSAPSAPGQLASHYAPEAALRLEAVEARPGERHLGFGAVAGDLSLSAAGDLTEAAANLFHHLRKLDAAGGRIAVAPIPDRGLGRAINDRLMRAAAPRPGAADG